MPERIRQDLPGAGQDVRTEWAALGRDFVADIQGEPHRPYLTFRDSLRYQEAIDATRAGQVRQELSG